MAVLPDFVVDAWRRSARDGRVFYPLTKSGKLYAMLANAEKASGVTIPDRLGFHILRHTWADCMRRYAGLDTAALVETGAWRSRKSASVYEPLDATDEAMKGLAPPEFLLHRNRLPHRTCKFPRIFHVSKARVHVLSCHFLPNSFWAVLPASPRDCGENLVLQERIELSTSPLPRECSTTELLQRLERRERRRPSVGVPAIGGGPWQGGGGGLVSASRQPARARGRRSP